MSNPTGNRIVLHSDIPLEEMLAHLEGDHARVLVALLMYGTLTALEEGHITVDTGYRIVLNWPVMLYLEDNPKPRDRILVEAVSSSIEIGAISRHFGLHMVPRSCRDIKAKFAPWFAQYLGDSPVPIASRSKKISLTTDLPLDKIMLDLEANHVRALVTFLIYGALTVLEEGRITFDVAARVVLNHRVLRHCRERLRPRDQALEETLSDSGELETASNAGRQEDVVRLCAKMKTRAMR